MKQPMMKPESAASARHISGLPAVEYHAMRALSASSAWLLAEECAAKFLWRSPWNTVVVRTRALRMTTTASAPKRVSLSDAIREKRKARTWANVFPPFGGDLRARTLLAFRSHGFCGACHASLQWAA